MGKENGSSSEPETTEMTKVTAAKKPSSAKSTPATRSKSAPAKSATTSKPVSPKQSASKSPQSTTTRRSVSPKPMSSTKKTSAKEAPETAADDTSVTISTTSSKRRANNPISKFLKDVEEKQEKKKLDKIAESYARINDMLKPTPIPENRIDRLNQLKAAKREANLDGANQDHTTGETNGTEQEKESKTKVLMNMWLKYSQGKDKFNLVGAFSIMLFITLYGSFGIRIPLSADSWMQAIFSNIQTILYISVCAILHFGVLDIALLAAFDALEIGKKSLHDVKQYYNDVVRLVALGTSLGIMMYSILYGFIMSFLRIVTYWWTKHADESTSMRFVVGILEAIYIRQLFTMIFGLITTFLYYIFSAIQYIAGTIFTVIGFVMKITSLDLLWTKTPLGWSVNRIYLVFASILQTVFVDRWNESIRNIVASTEYFQNLPSWRGHSLDTSCVLYAYTCIFVLSVLVLSLGMFPSIKQKQEPSQTKVTSNTSSSPSSQPSSPTTEMESSDRRKRRKSDRQKKRDEERNKSEIVSYQYLPTDKTTVLLGSLYMIRSWNVLKGHNSKARKKRREDVSRT